jgi:hypothetical protein
VDLVRLYNEAVIIPTKLGVVACFGIDANGVEARSIVVRCKRIVVGSSGIGTSSDFKRVTDSITVGISDAVSIAVVTGFVVEARTIIVGGIGVIVAGRIIGTSSDFKRVADSITVGVSDAVAIAVVTGFGVGA